ncbi:hypothetical protein PR202_ga14539 [Eleusine coracana subsp. coracana]|uniref:Uncharacterized protein n=1 Tax=Eleusine coracana subsp. coracana TaxID=191504 RepID=A0AAV5CHQ5_ELECO|nr:hypothetical protein PR202_ga14539 [Eleusine coracana subsp. coracana]
MSERHLCTKGVCYCWTFRLRGPRLRVFNWSCTYADEVCIDSVGHLSDVVIELAAGRKPMQYDEELSYVTVDQRDKLMRNILQGLMPGLRPLKWDDIKRYALKCVQRDDRWMCFELTNDYTVTQRIGQGSFNPLPMLCV